MLLFVPYLFVGGWSSHSSPHHQCRQAEGGGILQALHEHRHLHHDQETTEGTARTPLFSRPIFKWGEQTTWKNPYKFSLKTFESVHNSQKKTAKWTKNSKLQNTEKKQDYKKHKKFKKLVVSDWFSFIRRLCDWMKKLETSNGFPKYNRATCIALKSCSIFYQFLQNCRIKWALSLKWLFRYFVSIEVTASLHASDLVRNHHRLLWPVLGAIRSGTLQSYRVAGHPRNNSSLRDIRRQLPFSLPRQLRLCCSGFWGRGSG